MTIAVTILSVLLLVVVVVSICMSRSRRYWWRQCEQEWQLRDETQRDHQIEQSNLQSHLAPQ